LSKATERVHEIGDRVQQEIIPYVEKGFTGKVKIELELNLFNGGITDVYKIIEKEKV